MFRCPYCRNKVERWGLRQRTCGKKHCYKKHKKAMQIAGIEERRIWRRKYESNLIIKQHRQRKFSIRQIERDRRINELKSKPCTDCGHAFPPECMDFDHVKGKKIIKISTHRMYHRWETLLKEIAKCELVCANCHRIRTKKRRKEKERKDAN